MNKKTTRRLADCLCCAVYLGGMYLAAALAEALARALGA